MVSGMESVNSENRMKKILLLVGLAIGLAGTAFAQDGTYRFYDQFGMQTGSARSDGMGGYRFYNPYGLETGSARSDGMGGYHFYDPYGMQTGSQRGH